MIRSEWVGVRPCFQALAVVLHSDNPRAHSHLIPKGLKPTLVDFQCTLPRMEACETIVAGLELDLPLTPPNHL